MLTTSLVPRVHQPLSKIRARALFPPRPLLKYGENVETRKPPRALFQNSAMIERYIIPTWLPLCMKFDRPVLLLEGQTWPCGARTDVMLVYSVTMNNLSQTQWLGFSVKKTKILGCQLKTTRVRVSTWVRENVWWTTFGPGRQITFSRLAKKSYVHAVPNSKICPYDHVRVRS